MSLADRHSPAVVLHSDTARRSCLLGASVHLKLVAHSDSRVMRVVHAIQTLLVRSALVVTEFQPLAVFQRQAYSLAERPGVSMQAPHGDGRSVETHPARDPLAG